jgi:ABC-2 type transport system ATP-binding protein
MSTMHRGVQVDDAHYSYGRTRALAGVSLDVGPGVTGLLGRNGAGKTTLLQVLATVITPDAGRLRLLDRDPADSCQRIEIRRRLGYLPQEPRFYPEFTAFEFVDYVAILKEHTDRRARHREVRRALEAVDVDAVAGIPIGALSYGMCQRVALAQALLGDPELLVLDEPTAGLDPEHRLHLRDLILRLGEDRTIVLATHQTEEVSAMCHHVVVMNAGTVAFTGTPDALSDLARGKVWLTASHRPEALRSWRTAKGQYRNHGDPPNGAQVVDPTIEDGYLFLGDQTPKAVA